MYYLHSLVLMINLNYYIIKMFVKYWCCIERFGKILLLQ